MFLKRIKENLFLRIFLITSLILLAASVITFGIIAWATPITYISISTERFMQQAAELPPLLEQVSLEECGPVLDQFIMDTGAGVTILNEQGEIVNTPSNLSIGVIYEDANSVVAVSKADGGGEDGVEQWDYTISSGADDGNISVSSECLSYPFSFKGMTEVYFVYIMPPMEKANQTVQAMGQIAPWLLGIMLLFAPLCALFYSRYVTRPIVRLNTALQQDIDKERELERQRLAFFSAASHELKTPITILKGQLSGMLEGIDIYQDRDKYLGKALQVTGRMEGLVQEILTVSRMESGNFEMHMKSLDLAELVRSHLELDEDLLIQKNIQLHAILPENIFVGADLEMMGKVMDNILSNAIFYAPDGAELFVRIERAEAGPTLMVENSGSHIDEEALPHVFEAFYRADLSRNRRTGGSGLGLYIVKMILERHGAAYEIQNTEQGVRFNIYFSEEDIKRPPTFL